MPNSWEKDPLSILDYTIDWSTWLSVGETISTSAWAISPTDTFTKKTDTKTTTTTTIWLQGGTIGETYTVTNKIVTTAGREERRALSFTIKNR